MQNFNRQSIEQAGENQLQSLENKKQALVDEIRELEARVLELREEKNNLEMDWYYSNMNKGYFLDDYIPYNI